MIIKKLIFKNFRTYYGADNCFDFHDGLTLIIGDNGDGKTSFFEAIQWLLNTTIDKGDLEDMSDMCKAKMEIGEEKEVSVFMLFEHDGEKSIEKSFSVTRVNEDFYRLGEVKYRGYETNVNGRERVNGKLLINRCYDAFIQRFSMFKGESELNVFENQTLLKELVDKFSDIRKFDTIVDYTSSFEKKAETQYLKEMRSDKKVEDEAKRIEDQITNLSQNITNIRKDIRDKESSLNLYSDELKKLESNQETSESYKDIQSRLKNKEEKKIKLIAQISNVDYNHALLDKMWILCAFSNILQEFKQKCSAISIEKRRQEKEYEHQKSIEIGKLEAVKEIQGALTNGTPELPWYLPNQETMEEMLNDHICKVCGRPAEEGSDAYKFMMRKLEDYKRHIALEAEKKNHKVAIEEMELFKYENIESLHSLSLSLSGSNESRVSSLINDIKDRLDLVERLNNDLKVVEKEIQEAKDEKARLLIQAGNVSEASLEKDFNDIKGLFEQKNRAEVRLAELKGELELAETQRDDLKKDLEQLNPDSTLVLVYRKVHHALEEIAKAFASAKKENLRRFLSDMQNKANEYLYQLSGNDFSGEIRLTQTADDSTKISLFTLEGNKYKPHKNPSASQKTVMYISVICAISDFTQENREEDYPLIFDAPTSSFGKNKQEAFYNVIDTIKKQCIIVTKDFIDDNGMVQMNKIEKLTCSVYTIKKANGFIQNNSSTLRSIIEKIK